METTAKKSGRSEAGRREAKSGRTTMKVPVDARALSSPPSAAHPLDAAKRARIVEMEGKVVGMPRRERAKRPEEIKDSTLHLRLREDLKEDAASVLADIGISLPEAIRVFLGRLVSEGKFPFELEVPNAVTRRAMGEARRLDGGRFATASELFDDVEKGGAR